MFMLQKLQQEMNLRLQKDQQAAQSGSAVGLYKMGIRFRYGWGVPKDYQEGLNLLKKAANHPETHAGACYELARLYLHGYELEGICQDFIEALNYAERGAKADPNSFQDIEGYNQEDMVKQSQSLIKTIEAVKTLPRYKNLP